VTVADVKECYDKPTNNACGCVSQSNDPAETIPISAFQQKQRPRHPLYSPPKFVPGAGSPGGHMVRWIR